MLTFAASSGGELREGYAPGHFVDAWSKLAGAEANTGPVVQGRGTQDMKCVCVQYIEAIHRLQQRAGGWTPVRTVYLTYVPDEEIGGKDGINKVTAQKTGGCAQDSAWFSLPAG